jgi:hypothetical protein
VYGIEDFRKDPLFVIEGLTVREVGIHPRDTTEQNFGYFLY